MVDSDAERQRRRRAHARGDHRLCLPARCRDAGASPVRPAEPAAADRAREPEAIPAAVFSSAPPPVTPSPTAAPAAPPGLSAAALAEPTEPGDTDSVAAAIRADIEAMGELVGIEGSLAAMAIKLGTLIDDEPDPKVVATLIREARTTLTDLTLSLSPRSPKEEPKTEPAAGEVSDADGWSGMDHPA